ncbi:helix-hairpin-helix domain-containing protein [Photobacterium swingsii]|uniref:Transporter n=1 Tax=Photobacterium swingsii TaxID=680026 RepID=A0A0J8XXU7_9GAMM|nr:helix-hairpin-helix domain-containing protein [Photobacterium swingsii]KMV30264.1 transporter [Photobacterium swingsii]PSW23265.1 transporter [Photobacterium swingsii]
MKRLLVSALLCGAVLVALPVSANDSHEGIEITININDANAEELDKLLVGIGPEKAENIILYRKQYGDFKTADDLTKVKGIGLATVEKNRDRIEL